MAQDYDDFDSTIAEDMLDGSCCQHCGQYFEHPKKDENGKSIGIYVHEHPVTCWECWDEFSKGDKKNYIKADVKTF